ncbi:MAG: ABC transporter C-terminal domain-containing protein [Hyphomonas sp.]|nr:ABC transporter C-terminal domain-containing protein [Hyphomonas sp.]
MQEAEKRVEKLTAEIVKIDAQLADPALYADAQRTQKITLERGLIAKKLAEAEEQWMAATAAFEEAEQTQDETAVS